jgi:hypothetical protein
VKKLVSLFILIAALPVAASAQVVPRVTLFGGYTLVHAQQNGGFSFNLNGWDVSAELKPASWLGVVGDVSQQYASPSGLKERQTTFLFGPQFTLPGIKNVKPFAHILVGGIHGTDQVNYLTAVPLTGPCTLSNCGALVSSYVLGTKFATAVGGGVDFKLAGPVWVRAIQVDYLHADLNPDHHTNVRVAAGIALRF